MLVCVSYPAREPLVLLGEVLSQYAVAVSHENTPTHRLCIVNGFVNGIRCHAEIPNETIFRKRSIKTIYVYYIYIL